MANSVDSVLGKQLTEYKSTYDPSILAREPRQGNRTQYDIDGAALPFVGFDTWRAWEISTLTTNGLPVNGIIKMRVPADSEYIVESKSLKLYFFSFNMERLADTKESVIRELLEIAHRDISEVVGASINLSFWDAHSLDETTIETSDMFTESTALEDVVDLENIVFDTYNETPGLLKEGDNTDFYVYSDMLRSNCKITNQSDYGTVFIKMKGAVGVDFGSLAQYIVSFRGENHFHEEIVECIYKRLYDTYKPEDLMVAALYTRRGGIDICPVRATHAELFPTVLPSIAKFDVKDYRQ